MPRPHRLILLTSLCLLAALSTAAGTTYPGCPDWSHTFTFVNNCSTAVTVDVTPGCFSTQSNTPPLSAGCWTEPAGGSFNLDAAGGNDTHTVSVTSCWSGNFGVGCTSCETPVKTLAEFTVDGGLDPATLEPLGGPGNWVDTYDVSLVDGYTHPFEISPNTSQVPPAPGAGCGDAGCTSTPTCPEQLVDGDACLSPCQYAVANGLSNEDQLKYCCVCSMTESCPCTDDGGDVPTCCVGQYGCSPFSPPGNTNPASACCPWYDDPTQDCSATSADRAWDAWAQDYIAAVHASCPGEYAWQYDDQQGTFTCQGNDQPMSYTITVCP